MGKKPTCCAEPIKDRCPTPVADPTPLADPTPNIRAGAELGLGLSIPVTGQPAHTYRSTANHSTTHSRGVQVWKGNPVFSGGVVWAQCGQLP